MNDLDEGFIAGYAGLCARADLLDRINVFPVADSDTGANLRISLGPLRACGGDRAVLASRIRRLATGNSGNIAAAFFSELLPAAGIDDLPRRAARGRARAWEAVAEPQPGTMLSVFDGLDAALATSPLTAATCPTIISALQQAVVLTASTLADLRSAGVVDAGALGMFVFFDGFCRTLTGYRGPRLPLAALFPDLLAIRTDFHPPASGSFCVDTIIRPGAGRRLDTEAMAALGESVVVVPDEDQVKIHIHTPDPQDLRRRLELLGEVVGWSDEALRPGTEAANHSPVPSGSLHIMTDAAGSLPREMARRHGITLLDSYIVAGEVARPESLCDPGMIYARMRAGEKVTTAQASLVERHELYAGVCEEYGSTLYLCVGSAFTGNHATAAAWKRDNGRQNLLDIIDTGAASGRLAVIALLVARHARRTVKADTVRALAATLVDSCREYVFIDTLRYLVAGGRVSRAGGWFGELLQLKPVISPTREGVRRVGVVRNRDAQLAFASDRLRHEAVGRGDMLVLLQYSDNRGWVEETVRPRVRSILPEAELLLVPLSLTSGVHMGPGTWSLAFAPVP